MIRLTNFITTQERLVDGSVQSSVVTDTLLIASANFDFTTGELIALIQRGTVTEGIFSQNFPDVTITVKPDGSFSSSDSVWSGSLANAGAFMDTLKASLDNMLLSAGLITGAVIS